MNSHVYPVLAFGFLFLAAATVTRAQSTGREPATAVAPLSDAPEPARAAGASAPSQVLSSAESDYVLTPGDTIEMTIFREPDLNSRSSIARDGTVQLPLIQEVKLAGLTIRDARNLLHKLYNNKYLVNPQVYLNIVQFAQRKFTILGQVLKPGSYQLEGGETLSLLEAIGIAGGFTSIADHGHILIKRQVNGKSQAIKANAKRMAAGKDEPILILPGDVVTVGESWY